MIKEQKTMMDRWNPYSRMQEFREELYKEPEHLEKREKLTLKETVQGIIGLIIFFIGLSLFIFPHIQQAALKVM